jgi:hypothetical protein
VIAHQRYRKLLLLPTAVDPGVDPYQYTLEHSPPPGYSCQ